MTFKRPAAAAVAALVSCVSLSALALVSSVAQAQIVSPDSPPSAATNVADGQAVVTGPDSLSLPPLPPMPHTTLGPVAAATPHDAAALGHYDVLIADRGNKRLILVSPQKQILWEYHFRGVPAYNGADDAFFADGGKSVITNLEHSGYIEIISIATGKPVWHYGHLNRAGWRPGYLDFPDDAYQLPNRNIIVADIHNCRILEITPDKRIVRQGGRTRDCLRQPGTLRSPNGDTPLPGGKMLVSEIQGHSITELNTDWKPMLQFTLPIKYPSDPQPMTNGHILVAGYTRVGNIVEVDRQGRVLWRYRAQGPNGGLNRPSLAEELPNGNIIATDDLNQRVVVIDKKTSRIVWQYGVKGVRGSKPGYLHIPDGLAIIPEAHK